MFYGVSFSARYQVYRLVQLQGVFQLIVTMWLGIACCFANFCEFMLTMRDGQDNPSMAQSVFVICDLLARQDTCSLAINSYGHWVYENLEPFLSDPALSPDRHI